MEGYYDHHPTTYLARPLALVGGFGSGAALVAHALSARTGLPFADLDRWVEHAAGSSIAALLVRTGEHRYRELARQGLDQALRSAPPPVIALGPDVLQDRECRRRARAEATLVYLRATPEELARRVRAQLAEQPARFFPHLRDDEVSAEALAALLEERRAGYEVAEHVIDIGDRHPQRVATELAERLGL